MAAFDSIEELTDELFYYGSQDLYGVICSTPGHARNWGFQDGTIEAARVRASELQATHGVEFRAAILRVTPRLIITTG